MVSTKEVDPDLEFHDGDAVAVEVLECEALLYPLIQHEQDLKRHGLEAALLVIPGQLVRPIFHFVTQLSANTERGRMFRGLEQVFVAIEDEDSAQLEHGMEEVLSSWLKLRLERIKGRFEE